jgi:hypothetical protein
MCCGSGNLSDELLCRRINEMNNALNDDISEKVCSVYRNLLMLPTIHLLQTLIFHLEGDLDCRL